MRLAATAACLCSLAFAPGLGAQSVSASARLTVPEVVSMDVRLRSFTSRSEPGSAPAASPETRDSAAVLLRVSANRAWKVVVTAERRSGAGVALAEAWWRIATDAADARVDAGHAYERMDHRRRLAAVGQPGRRIPIVIAYRWSARDESASAGPPLIRYTLAPN